MSPHRRSLALAGVVAWLVAVGCGENETALVLNFDTQPTCAAADATCINAGTDTLVIRGMRVIHKRLPGHPLVSFRLSFDAPLGSSRQSWAETLALSMYALGGPRWLEASEWDAELVRLGADIDAGYGLDYGSIRATGPVVNWHELWALVVLGIADYRNYPWELENRRGVFEQSLLSERDDPDAAASSDAWSRLFQGQAYNYRRDYQETLASISSEDIDDAWGTLARSDRWLVTIVGDVSAEEIDDALGLAQSLLATSEPPPRFAPDPVSTPGPSPHIRVLPYPDAPTWHVEAYFKGPSGDSAAQAPLELGLSVLDRRLFEQVRDVRGLAYTTGASLSFYRESFGNVWITSEAPREAVAVARQIISDLKTTGPSEAELAAARSSLLTALLTGNDTPTGMAATLADWELTAGSRQALDAYLTGLELATPAHVADVLDAFLRDVEITAAGGGSALTEPDLETWFVAP